MKPSSKSAPNQESANPRPHGNRGTNLAPSQGHHGANAVGTRQQKRRKSRNRGRNAKRRNRLRLLEYQLKQLGEVGQTSDTQRTVEEAHVDLGARTDSTPPEVTQVMNIPSEIARAPGPIESVGIRKKLFPIVHYDQRSGSDDINLTYSTAAQTSPTLRHSHATQRPPLRFVHHCNRHHPPANIHHHIGHNLLHSSPPTQFLRCQQTLNFSRSR
jgi:hypothetical protein